MVFYNLTMELRYYIIRRFLILIPTLFGLVLLTFILLRAIPTSDLIASFISQKATAQERVIEKQQAIAYLGLNQPLPVQFLYYLNDIIHGNLGVMYTSFYTGPVMGGIERFLPYTLELSIATVILSILIAIPLGTYIGARPNSPSDAIGRIFSLGVYAMPIFWLALLAQIIFGKNIGIFGSYGFPISGEGYPTTTKVPWIVNNVSEPTHMLFVDALLHGNLTIAYSAFIHLILPVGVLTLSILAGLLRFIRAGMVDTANQEFVKTARAKGVPEKLVLRRHVRKNALLPSVTVIGLLMAGLLGGVVVIEYVFQLRGMGRLTLATITGLNIQFYGVAGTVLFFGIILMITNLIVDVVYAFLDPRIRY